MAIGDHLVVDFGWYQHHGIDVGNDEVVHFGRGLHDIKNAKIELVTRDAFSRGRLIMVQSSPDAFDREAIADRARSRIGESGYDVIDNNCEHFARWCRTGVSQSPQASTVETGVRQAAAAISKPILARAAVPFVRQAASKLAVGSITGGKLVRATVRTSRATLVADAAQGAVEIAMAARGKSAAVVRAAGLGTGATVSAVAGLISAGRIGGIAGVTIWAVGQVVGKAVTKLGKRTVQRA